MSVFDINNKSFCMYPWIHLHTNPEGKAAPCCISTSCNGVDSVGDAKTSRLNNLINSPKMNQLRLDMLSGTKNNECVNCYAHEGKGVKSSRQYVNEQYGHLYNEVIQDTNLEDGSLKHFKMRYFDIRFSNICNFKCRTCGQEYSSQWENENLKNNVSYARHIPKNNNKLFLQDVLDQIEYFDTAYFAGGEPLITEEHYIILEEMIRKNRTDVSLRYNTNLSNLKFKDKNLLHLWSFFNKVSISSSIDHYGKRAEYIRNGTDWAVVENNFKMIKQQPNIDLTINTVLSVFNYLTIFEFYKYLIDNQMYTKKDFAYSLYCASTPWHIACHVLPETYKIKGKESVNRAIEYFRNHSFSDHKIKQLEITHLWANSLNTWNEYGQSFKDEIRRLDKIRGENFESVFPELAGLLNE